MRNLLIALAFASLAIATSANAGQLYGNNPYDPGCNVNVGGNCGKQLDMWNNTWARMHLPLEPGQGAHGYYPSRNPGMIVNGIRSIIGGGGGIRYGARPIAQPVATPQLVPVGPVIQHPANVSGLMCKRTYSDGRVVMYPGVCQG